MRLIEARRTSVEGGTRLVLIPVGCWTDVEAVSSRTPFTTGQDTRVELATLEKSLQC